MEGLHADEGFVGGNHSKASLRGCRRLEKESRGEQQCMQEVYQPSMIQTKGLFKGNEPYLISPSDLIAAIGNERWRIYESKLRTWRLS